MADRFLSFDERRKLIRSISGLYIFTDGGAPERRVFLQESAGLGRFTRSMALSGAADGVVANLVGRLEEFGELPERPTFHALGALLDAVLEMSDAPSDTKQFLASLIVRYSLVTDPMYIQNLRDQYHLDDAVQRAPVAAQVIKLPEKGISVASPAFTAAIPDEQALETVINSEDNFLDINHLYGAIYSSQAVCLIEIPEGKPAGTGFLVNKDLILTNHHVLKNIEYVRKAVARFGYMLDAFGGRAAGRVIPLHPDFYESSPAEELDYALVRLAEPAIDHLASDQDLVQLAMPALVANGKHRGYLSLLDYYITQHERVNIVQHPEGNLMKVVMTQNTVVADMSATRVQYVADTMDGSSGSPVFNQKWQVVALHHSGAPYPPESVKDTIKKAWKGNYRVNEGIPMRAILQDFRKKNLSRYLPGS